MSDITQEQQTAVREKDRVMNVMASTLQSALSTFQLDNDDGGRRLGKSQEIREALAQFATITKAEG